MVHIQARLARGRVAAACPPVRSGAGVRTHAPARGTVPRIRRTATDDAVNRVIHATLESH